MTRDPQRPTIRVNGQVRHLEVRVIAELIEQLGHGADSAGVAVALNGEVVPRAEWGTRRLRDGDTVEIVGAVQGG